MKIYYNSKIAKLFTFIDGFSTIMLFGAVFTEKKNISKTTMYHEQAHITQYQSLFGIGAAMSVLALFICFAFNIYGLWMLSFIALPIMLYYIWYGIEFLIRYAIYFNFDMAYKMIAFEQEAYKMQYEHYKKCEKRTSASSFSFFKYY